MLENKPSFPGEEKAHKEALEINEQVDRHFENPRVSKSKSKSEIAHGIIKDKINRPVHISRHTPLEKLEPEERWIGYLYERGITVLTDGYLEIERWDKSIDSPAKRVRQKIDGINSAIRMQDHILEQYGQGAKENVGEMEQIESIEEVVEKANLLLARWKLATRQEKEEIQQELIGIVLQLEHCRNEFKVEARDQAEKISDLTDSLGRENPNALSARTIAALNRLEKRMDEIHSILPIIAMRKELLALEKRRQESYIKKATSHLSILSRHGIFSERAASHPESFIHDFEVEFLNVELRKALHNLGLAIISPYKQQADQAEFFIKQDILKNVRTKKSIITNRATIKEKLDEIISILKSDMSDRG